ncbi:GTP 3',8-cyclase MoaA [Rapidithrix thailandica]|uniref:GTP 3',8-cyclase n=1 Tax=Rapidithrix thailandica TaxID=413964 RepID=A0AAW9S6K3_9BACT
MKPKAIIDNHGRPVNYLRLAVTDRCNLRCFYCMPEEGIHYLPKKELLTYEEMLRLCQILASLGINKVRITGGEPFVRKDLLYFLKNLRKIKGIDKISLTTNGVLTYDYIPDLVELGISMVNLSLDTLDAENFLRITRRNEFEKVMQTFYALVESGISTKINTVVMDGKNTEDLIPLAQLTEKHPVSVRFIEEMPFNGEGNHYATLKWSHHKILDTLRQAYPNLQKLPVPAHSTATLYQVPGFQGNIGIIAAFSRTFCGTCNRIRITAQGLLKTCLYDEGVLDLKQVMRSGANDQRLEETLIHAFRHRAKDGFEAEKQRQSNHPVKESMSTIGG